MENKHGNKYDKIAKENIDEIFLPFVLSKLGKEIVVEAILPDKLYTSEEREMDLLVQLHDQNGKVFLLHVEFQPKPDYDMIWRMIEYHGLITRKYKLPIVHFVIDFDAGGSNIMTTLDDALIFKGFSIIKLHDISYDKMVASEIPAEVILAILANFEEKPAEVIIRAIGNRLKEVSKSDAELKKYVAQLNMLARLRNLQDLTTQTISTMPIIFDIENDSIAKMVVDRVKRRDIERLLIIDKLSISEIAMVFEVSEELVLEVKTALEKRNKKTKTRVKKQN